MQQYSKFYEIVASLGSNCLEEPRRTIL